uniref:histidine kinase dimerization/phospho-acceptor domain-containing protein n=1 Tax=Geoalkalibacter sp. TaxID=3041440 RepID=UPI00272E73A9
MAVHPGSFLSALSLRGVLESLPVGLFLVDRRQHIVFWNSAAERITGFAAAEAVGRHCSFLEGIPCGRRCGLFDSKVPKPVTGVTCTIRGRDGRRITLAKSVDLLHGADGEVVGGVESFVDISQMTELEKQLRRHALEREQEVRKRTRELEEERAQLREANRELESFAATVAHDLRTPLTPIIGYAEFLQEQYAECLDAQALTVLGEIQSQGRRMLHLMEDLLTLARLGRLDPPGDPVPLAAVLAEVLPELRSLREAAGLEIRIGTLPRLHLPRTLLSELLANLIGNALRYTGPQGGPIEIDQPPQGGRRFFVRDHGPGVAPEEAERIFDPFYRGTHSKSLGGTGIG